VYLRKRKLKVRVTEGVTDTEVAKVTKVNGCQNCWQVKRKVATRTKDAY